MLSICEAQNIITELKKQEIALGRNPETWYTYENHVYGVANLAKFLAAELAFAHPERIYVAALLHDICRIEEERKKKFHGILGYEKLKNIDTHAARACLLHTFPWGKLMPFQQCKDTFFDNKQDYDFVVDYLSSHSTNDEDYLIQMCDNLANKNGLVTLEERAVEYRERHGDVNVDAIVIDSLEIKKYFDKKIGYDIYDYMNKYVLVDKELQLVV